MLRNRSKGFTLIELVVVMLVISFGLLGLTSLFSNTTGSLATNETLQRATQYAQECAERAVATQHNFGLDWFASNTFTCGTPPAGFEYNQVADPAPVGSLYIGTNATSPCPGVTTNCRDVTVVVRSVANPALSSTINVMLVDNKL